MNSTSLIKLLSAITLTIVTMSSPLVQAEEPSDLRFTLSDFKLNSAEDLVDICTVIPGDEHYELAISFCYGFFEGTVHYDEVMSKLGGYKDMVCPPPGATRQQAVAKFVNFMKGHPQFNTDRPVDGIFRSLGSIWPCKT